MGNTVELELLNAIFDYARKIGNNQWPNITAEQYVVAVCDLISGKFTVDKLSSERKKGLEEILRRAVNDLGELREILVKYLYDEHSKPEYYSDCAFMQVMIGKTKAQQQSDGTVLLMPECLLENILKNPSEPIKRVSVGKAQADGGFAEPEKEDTNPKKTLARITERVKNIREELLSKVLGQEYAVDVFTTGFFQAEVLSLTENNRKRPRATFLFAGPPGVGKTFLAETVASCLDMPFKRFDMSEYSDKDANLEFCGVDKSYHSAKVGNVTGYVAENPKCILLFDEIEKAHLNVIYLFLQILDAGNLRDNYTDKEVSFSDTIIIFTTNVGKQLYEQSETGNFSGFSRKVILKTLQNDINPQTSEPYFPPAICSRFASGNVVMFNHLSVRILLEIAKTEIRSRAEKFEKKMGISFDIDESIYLALLFSEGGSADGRTVRSRSAGFFNKELFELFRLLGSAGIEAVEKIKMSVDLPDNQKQSRIAALFNPVESMNVLVFSSEETAEKCICAGGGCCCIHQAQTIAAAEEILQNNDINTVLVDIGYGQNRKTSDVLNTEDVDSVSRDFLRYISEKRRELPVYLLQTGQTVLSSEETVSFSRQGIRGVIILGDDSEAFARKLSEICTAIYSQNSVEYLAKSNKIITFETAQSFSEGGTAEIRLFDFKLDDAVEAEDTDNILSSVSKPNVRFNDVIGAEDAKKELRYFVEYLKNPKKYAGMGVRAPKGVILYGPPGTGKTMLAKAMACESDVTFISAEGNQFLKKHVGEGKDSVHELFRVARKYAPSILFVDEIDTIAKERRGGEHAMANGEDVLTAFLSEMDGFKSEPSRPVFVLAATNYDVEAGHAKSLDPAIIRRFDRKIYISLPDKEGRKKFINKKIEDNRASFAVSKAEIDNIAVRSTGMSLAELDSVMELALRSAIRDGSFMVTDEVLEDAFETYNSGDVKKWDEALLERVARHETGHAVLCLLSGEIPSYLTVVPRGNYGGYMQHGDSEGKAIYTKEELLAKIRISLGGRASEIVYYGEKDGVSTGAAGDLVTATRLARQLICSYGMDADFGLAVIDGSADTDGEPAAEVRAAVNKILDEQMKLAIDLIREKRDIADAVASELMSKNHMTGGEIKALVEKVMAG